MSKNSVIGFLLSEKNLNSPALPWYQDLSELTSVFV